MLGFAGTALQAEWDRRTVTNVQDAGAKNDAAARAWPTPSATTSYLQTLQIFRLQTGY
jgi:hypothetical protein